MSKLSKIRARELSAGAGTKMDTAHTAAAPGAQASLEVPCLVVFPPEPKSASLPFTETVRAAPPSSVAPDNAILDDPAAAAIAPPPQLPVNPFGFATVMPA